MKHSWDETHFASINCRLRVWRNEKALQGWKHAKLSLRFLFDALHVPYEVSPFDAKHGQVLYVNAEVHKILSQTRVRFFTFAGPIWLKRPAWLIEKWLREYADSR